MYRIWSSTFIHLEQHGWSYSLYVHSHWWNQVGTPMKEWKNGHITKLPYLSLGKRFTLKLMYSKIEDEQSRVQVEVRHFASSKDKNPITTSMSYFRIIEDIWEIDYVTFKVSLFKCKWVEGNWRYKRTKVHL